MGIPRNLAIGAPGREPPGGAGRQWSVVDLFSGAGGLALAGAITIAVLAGVIAGGSLLLVILVPLLCLGLIMGIILEPLIARSTQKTPSTH